jgi:hypothetical protein
VELGFQVAGPGLKSVQGSRQDRPGAMQQTGIGLAELQLNPCPKRGGVPVSTTALSALPPSTTRPRSTSDVHHEKSSCSQHEKRCRNNTPQPSCTHGKNLTVIYKAGLIE